MKTVEKTDIDFQRAISRVDIYYVIKDIPVGIVFLRCPNGKITFANERAKILYGADPTGREYNDISTKQMSLYRANGEPYPTADLPMIRALRGINVTNEELMIERHTDGSRIIVSATTIGLTDKGSIIGAVGVFEDITERRRLEEELKQYTKNLETLVEERTKQLKDAERLATIGETAGMIGHDIRNPLQSIVSELYLAKSKLLAAPDSDLKRSLVEGLSLIEEQLSYITKIVADLQDYARPLKPELVEVGDLCSVIEQLLSTVKVPNNINSSISCKSLPKVKVDLTFLQRILVNLAINAIQAMPNGGKLDVAVFQKESKVCISVSDTGVGISEELKPKLFTPMVTTKAKGQGFGLAVVKRLVEAQGGRISFESEVGKGTKFIIELPFGN